MTDSTYEDVYVQYHSKVFAYVKARINNHHDAEDITSEVFIKIMGAYDSFDSQKASLSTWIYTITANTVRDHLRKTAVRTKSSIDISEEYFEVLASEEDSAFDEICREESLEVLADALEALNERERMIIIMHYYKKIPHKELAEHIGLSYANVRFINHSALQKLRSLMSKKGYF